MIRPEPAVCVQAPSKAGVTPPQFGRAALTMCEREPVTIPAVSRPLLRWFSWYCRWYIGRHFHSLRIAENRRPEMNMAMPLVLYLNHASWWDPLVGLVLTQEYFPDRIGFAPIDAAALGRYQFFGKLGFFGVEQSSRSGAAHFLRTASVILQEPNHLLALTPQGRFCDVRERPSMFRPGLGHLATRVKRARYLPLAIEYVFWEERLPEILVRFGEAVELDQDEAAALGPDGCTALFEQGLTQTQDSLGGECQRRDASQFHSLLSGASGQGGVYDLWRACWATLRGESFRKEHGIK